MLSLIFELAKSIFDRLLSALPRNPFGTVSLRTAGMRTVVLWLSVCIDFSVVGVAGIAVGLTDVDSIFGNSISTRLDFDEVLFAFRSF